MEGVQSAGDCNGGGYVLQQQTATVGAMLGLRLVCRINSSTDTAAGTQALWKRNRRDTPRSQVEGQTWFRYCS
jgi:hypothetical protein